MTALCSTLFRDYKLDKNISPPSSTDTAKSPSVNVHRVIRLSLYYHPPVTYLNPQTLQEDMDGERRCDSGTPSENHASAFLVQPLARATKKFGRPNSSAVIHSTTDLNMHERRTKHPKNSKAFWGGGGKTLRLLPNLKSPPSPYTSISRKKRKDREREKKGRRTERLLPHGRPYYPTPALSCALFCSLWLLYSFGRERRETREGREKSDRLQCNNTHELLEGTVCCLTRLIRLYSALSEHGAWNAHSSFEYSKGGRLIQLGGWENGAVAVGQVGSRTPYLVCLSTGFGGMFLWWDLHPCIKKRASHIFLWGTLTITSP